MGMRRDDYARHSKKVTSTRRWQSVRAAVLERDGWACVDCGTRRGRLEVDHIEAVRLAPGKAFDPANCATRCSACHTKKTRIECGHAPVSEDRQAWRDSVLTLEREGNTNPKQTGETPCLTL